MATDEAPRRQLIQSAMANRIGEVPEIALQLWQPLLSQLISIIGEGGFSSLYDRSLHLTRATFPWLAAGEPLRSIDSRFSELKVNLAGQGSTEANKASHMLILTFTDILASLVGEPLTIDILGSAWNNHASQLEIAGKESPHEQ
jgi:hypothetical protein